MKVQWRDFEGRWVTDDAWNSEDDFLDWDGELYDTETDIRTYCKSEVKRWGFPFRIIDNDTREVIEEFHKETTDERG